MLLKNVQRQSLVLFIFLALSFSLLDISKVFFDPHCLAFDLNDDANHTFVNLQQWRRIISQGEWPMMNVYNNFGTPLIGDVITYPLSPLSLTYALLPGPQAMTINRLLISVFTLFLLFIFYHRRFPRGISIGLGLCTFYAPGFLWHSAHHHFQLSLLLLTAFILLQETFSQRMSAGTYLGMCAISILMFMSISLNVVMILAILIVGYQIYLSGDVKEKSFWIVVSAFGCGFLAVFPDILLFTQAASRSMRKLAEYPVASTEGPNKIFLTPIIAAGIYCIALFREKNYKQSALIFWLGVFPFGIVLLSQTVPILWKQIPLLGATDVVRLTWGASIFLMLGAGGLILKWQVFICLIALGVDAFYVPFRQDWIFWGKWLLTIGWLVTVIGFIGWVKLGRGMIWLITCTVVIFYLYYGFFAVLGFAFPRMPHVRGLAAFSLDGSEKYPLPKALLVIPKNSRVAYDYNSIYGFDLRGATEGIFGSGARSTIMTNEDFTLGLFNQGLIKFDNYTGDYHFSQPWRAHDLQELGISYVMQGQGAPLPDPGWKLVEEEQGAQLYQNPLSAGVVYLKKGEVISPIPFLVQGNGFDIALPAHHQDTQKLVISLLKIPGWHVWIDGHEGCFQDDASKFLVLPVSAGDHFIKVRYAPISPVFIFLCFMMALVFPMAIIRRL